MEILATAIIPATSPSDVVLLPYQAMDSRRTDQGVPGVGIAIARVNKPALTIWLRDAINHLLQGAPLDRPRPSGMLIERGAFTAEGVQVSVEDWYGRGRRLAVAQCPDGATAHQLTDQLNGLLGRP